MGKGIIATYILSPSIRQWPEIKNSSKHEMLPSTNVPAMEITLLSLREEAILYDT